MERLKDGMLASRVGGTSSQVEALVQDVIIDVIDPFVYQEALDLIGAAPVRGPRHLHRERPRPRRSFARSRDTSCSAAPSRRARPCRGRALHGRAGVLRSGRPRRSGSSLVGGSRDLTSGLVRVHATPSPISRCSRPSVTLSRSTRTRTSAKEAEAGAGTSAIPASPVHCARHRARPRAGAASNTGRGRDGRRRRHPRGRSLRSRTGSLLGRGLADVGSRSVRRGARET